MLLGYPEQVADPHEHDPVTRPLGHTEASSLAESMGLFATASRLKLLWALLEEERTVDDLARATGLTPSAASHQLRLLRQARLVAVRREGRHAVYSLFDHHVPDLLAALRHHHEHASAGGPTGSDGPAAQTPARTQA